SSRRGPIVNPGGILSNGFFWIFSVLANKGWKTNPRPTTAIRFSTGIRLSLFAGFRLGTTIDLNQPLPGAGAVNPRRAFFRVRPGLAGISYAVSDGLSN